MYYATNSGKQQKKRSSVKVTLTNSEAYEGFFFVSGPQRISDLLNQELAFAPFETNDGQILVLNKAHIVSVVPSEITGEEPQSRVPDHPYRY